MTMITMLIFDTQEAANNDNGKAPHSAWRNYDDFNEYFWLDHVVLLSQAYIFHFCISFLLSMVSYTSLNDFEGHCTVLNLVGRGAGIQFFF